MHKAFSYNECGLKTYTAEDFGGQVLIKLANDDSHIIVLKKEEYTFFSITHSCTQNVTMNVRYLYSVK